MSVDLEVSVKDEIVKLLGYGPTPLTSIEGFFHGEERRAVRGVVTSYSGLFAVFERVFPQTGSKPLWVKLKGANSES